MIKIKQIIFGIFLISLVTSCNDKNVLEPQPAPAAVPKKIGDSYQGGTIFYVDSTGQHGLIAAPEDNHTNFGIGGWYLTYSFAVSGITGTVGTKIKNAIININHSNIGDLYITLKAPSGAVIYLSNLHGGAGDNYTNTTFSTVGTPIASGAAPFTGTYTPDQAFSNLSASTANGTWQIQVGGNSNYHGEFTGFTLNFTTGASFSPTVNSKNYYWDYNSTLNSNYAFSSNGNINTTTITNAIGGGSYAARVCQDLDIGGYQDWYLPSLSELSKLQQQKSVVPNLTSSATYWSSTEISSTQAYSINFLTAQTNYSVKNSYTNYVRAIRPF